MHGAACTPDAGCHLLWGYRYAPLGPKHTFHSVKRFIGRARQDPAVKASSPSSEAPRRHPRPCADRPELDSATSSARARTFSTGKAQEADSCQQVEDNSSRVAYDVVCGEDDDAVVLRCDTLEEGILYPEEANPRPSCLAGLWGRATLPF